jgi:DNA-binding transcriptional MerR regulator
MGNYYIKDLESITGIKAHTIRIWEQRYRLISPKRTQTNIRYYDDEDVKLLLNIALLNKKGLKISKIANLTLPEIHAEALNSCKKCNENDDLINSLILATYNLNESDFNKVLSEYIFNEGFENAMLKLAFPFLHRIGDLWVSDAIHPALEHFASNIIRNKLQIAISTQTHKKLDAKKFLLFLAPGEMHEISLLFSHFVISTAGHEVLYLGQNTPINDFESILNIFPADYVLSIFTNCKAEIDPLKLVNEIHGFHPEINILLSGFHILNNKEKLLSNFIIKERVTIMDNPSELSVIVENA